MSATNSFTETLTASTTASSVDTDGSGDTTVTVGELRTIESAADVEAQASGGYVAEVQSVNGNDVTVRVLEGNYGAASTGPLTAVASTADVCDISVKAEGY